MCLTSFRSVCQISWNGFGQFMNIFLITHLLFGCTYFRYMYFYKICQWPNLIPVKGRRGRKQVLNPGPSEVLPLEPPTNRRQEQKDFYFRSTCDHLRDCINLRLQPTPFLTISLLPYQVSLPSSNARDAPFAEKKYGGSFLRT